MAPKTGKIGIGVAGLLVAVNLEAQVMAGGHTWRVKEVFSNASGSVQFIEIVESCGTPNETGLIGHSVKANTNSVPLTSNLPPGTSSNKHILFGTANLPSFGGPTPDYIIPANFISLTGVTVEYTGNHVCPISSGAIPTNGTSSLNRNPGCNAATCPATVALNSPTNLAGASTPVNAPACVDGDSDGYGSPGDPSCPNGGATDCNDGAAAINPGAAEHCTDTLDNDCDSQIDCLDPDCAAVVPCVPTVSQWGVGVMVLLLLSAGTLITIRRRASTA